METGSQGMVSPARGADSKEACFTTYPSLTVMRDAGSVFLLPRGARVPLRVDGSAEEIWRRLVAGWSVSETAEDLSAFYQAEREIVEFDVQRLADQLLRENILIPLVEEPMPDLPFRVLTVCSGNICRSLYAERYLEKLLRAEDHSFEIASAGTEAGHGLGVPREIQDMLEGDGLSTRPHLPQKLNEQLIAEADLVLGATVDHRTRVLRLAPAALRKSFTVLEAAEAVRVVRDDEYRHPSPVAALAAARTSVPSGTPLDLADPFRGSAQEYATMKASMQPA